LGRWRRSEVDRADLGAIALVIWAGVVIVVVLVLGG